jgi:wyosine [tRNA(Phe)-imidazoG37] synthetase (radical SAM superfamily)
MKYIYGPVPSRRLGFSLGIDVVPYKTCTLDCIYCQLGRTTHKTDETKDGEEAIVEMTKRRPMTVSDIASVLGISDRNAEKWVSDLKKAGKLSIKQYKNQHFYSFAG